MSLVAHWLRGLPLARQEDMLRALKANFSSVHLTDGRSFLSLRSNDCQQFLLESRREHGRRMMYSPQLCSPCKKLK